MDDTRYGLPTLPAPWTDVIALKGLRVDCVVGVYPHERRMLQRLVFDVRLTTDVRAAARTDDVRQTIDYDQVAQVIKEITQRDSWLIETIAHATAMTILERFDLVEAAYVRVEKPGAMIEATTVAVEVERHRAELETA